MTTIMVLPSKAGQPLDKRGCWWKGSSPSGRTAVNGFLSTPGDQVQPTQGLNTILCRSSKIILSIKNGIQFLPTGSMHFQAIILSIFLQVQLRWHLNWLFNKHLDQNLCTSILRRNNVKIGARIRRNYRRIVTRLQGSLQFLFYSYS